MTRSLFLAGAVAALIWSPGALAKPDVAAVVKLACAEGDPTKQRDLSMVGLAEAVLVQSGYPVRSLIALGRTSNEDGYRDALVDMVITQRGLPDLVAEAVRDNMITLSQAFRKDSTVTSKDAGIQMTADPAFPTEGYDRFWFLRAPKTTTFACMAGKLGKGVMDLVTAPTTIPRVGIVKAVEDLAKAKDRETVDGAVLGVKVTRTTQDDGTIKKDTTLTFDGTVGVRLTGDRATFPMFAYANYTLSRARSNPVAALAPGKRRDDGDTNGLAVGFTINEVPVGEVFSFSGGLSFVADFAKDSERGVGTLTLTPGFTGEDLGFCGLGYLRPILIGKVGFRTMCVVAGQANYSHVFKVGRADFEDRGDFLALGGVVGIDVVAPLNAESGVVGSFRYRYLPTVSGRAPNVRRIDASLKYRWWLPGGLGLDFGGTYKRGEELKTYANEDEFLLTFGIAL